MGGGGGGRDGLRVPVALSGGSSVYHHQDDLSNCNSQD